MGDDSFIEPTILYVDDQPSHLALFKKAFQADYLVLTASSAEEGLKILNEHDIFLIIADHHMPQMGGIDFLKKAQGLSPQAIQAVLSAYSSDEIVREAAQKIGSVQHMMKPWKLDRMREFILEAQKKYEFDTLFPKTERTDRTEISPLSPSSQKILKFTEELESKVDTRGARRIFLNHVEPRLRDFIPVIQRPFPDLLRQAREAAIQGNYESMDYLLAICFHLEESISSSEEDNRTSEKSTH